VTIKSIVIVLCMVVFPSVFLYSEGTKQIMPKGNTSSQLCINKYRNDFAFYGAPTDFRLNISISSSSEAIRFGFGKVLSRNTNDLIYRIIGPSGDTVVGSSKIPVAGNGFIASYAQAVTGPFPGGYNYIELKPLTIGNYYLEFYYPPVYTEVTQHLLEFFDITVVNAAGNALEGRVWSKAWQFGSDNPRSRNSGFYWKMMILSDDSLVTQVDCNGFKGGSFSFVSNMYGCVSTGNLVNDRQSKLGSGTYPQYKIFLNNPDNNLFPPPTLTQSIIPPMLVTTNCATGGADFGIKVIKDGTIRLLIEINPLPGADPEDIQIVSTVKADPGGTGYNIITWNGNDNYGKPVQNGTKLTFRATNLGGIIHLPLYDVENNDFGLIVKQVRPDIGRLRVYWDDSQVGGASNTTIGCMNIVGCHSWNKDFGNNKTINSWWVLSWAEIEGTPFVSQRSPQLLNLAGNNVHCLGADNLEFSITPDPNSTSYNWTYSGTGVTIDTSGTKATLNFGNSATPGVLSVNGFNDTCGSGPITTMDIIFEPLPVVTLAPFPETCYTEPGFKLEGGEPEGGSYFVDGVAADSLFPYKESKGWHSIVYSYTTKTGCSNSDTTEILLSSGPNCQGKGTIFFPNAFTPDGDSINDTFRPVAKNIFYFTMIVFDRWGQQIYSTNDAAIGWDGMFKGKACPAGTYTYIATYGLSLREDNIETKRGTFVLLR